MVNLGGRSRKGSFTGGARGSGGMSKGGKFGKTRRGKFRVKSKFKLNDPLWSRRIGQARTKAMIAAGLLIRAVARNSIRYNKKKIMTPYGPQHSPSSPGTPPRAHTRHPTANIRNIQFDYNPASDRLMIGSVFFKRSYGTTVPSVHEHGKTVTVTKTLTVAMLNGRGGQARSTAQKNAWIRMRRQNHPRTQEYARKVAKVKKIKRNAPPKTITFPDRAYMKPALAKLTESGKLARRMASAHYRSLT